MKDRKVVTGSVSPSEMDWDEDKVDKVEIVLGRLEDEVAALADDVMELASVLSERSDRPLHEGP